MLRLRVWVCLIALSCSCFVLSAVAHVTNPSEVDALRAVKSSLIDSRNHLRNWGKGDPCNSNWTGVLCFGSAGTDGYLHVRELQLLSMNLSGTLVPELGKLSQLVRLDFMWNELTGTIPKEIGNITSLKLLLLNGNKLSGSVPDELGYLANLNRLQVDQNHLSGSWIIINFLDLFHRNFPTYQGCAYFNSITTSWGLRFHLLMETSLH